MSNNKINQGFTLVELLVVIAVIGILSTMAIIALGSARTKSRDAKRVADLKQISTALELFYDDHGYYPTIITPGNNLTSVDGTRTYLSPVPSNPSPQDDGNCGEVNYGYQASLTDDKFSVSSCLGDGTGAVSAGGVLVTSGTAVLPCGQATVIDIDGNIYNTVQIGTQCWMKENLRTKHKPNGLVLTNLGEGGVPSQRDCIDSSSTYCNGGWGAQRGTEADCTRGYTVYGWSAAMNGTLTAGTQGICPHGWHIPTDSEFGVLEQYLADPGQTCDINRNGSVSCLGAGTKLKTNDTSYTSHCNGTSGCNSSGFSGIIEGLRVADWNTFYCCGMFGTLWSSSGNGSNVWTRALVASSTGISRDFDPANHAFAVRCILD